MNNVCLTGRLTDTPLLKTTPTGKSVCSFSIAVRRDKDTTDFVRCVAWEGTAEYLCRWFLKGQKIAVEGRLQSRSYEDRTGAKRTVTEVVVQQVESMEKTEAAPKVTDAIEEVGAE